MSDNLEIIKNKFPFLSLIRYGNSEFLGIIQNSDNLSISMYILDIIPENLKKEFLELGEKWWWESNRSIPINIFLREDFKKFKPYINSFVKKEIILEFGHLITIEQPKKIKKKYITFIKKIDD